MINLNEEYFESGYYFLLREKKDGIHMWYSVSKTINEAREQDDYIKFPKDMLSKVQKYLDRLTKNKKSKTQKEVKSELEELVDGDGNLNSSRIPILDPRLFPKKTMDQTVATATQPSGNLWWSSRGGWGRSVQAEEDMSGAFGYEETKDLPPKQTIKKLADMGVDNPVERAIEFGKDPKIKQSKKSRGSKMRIRLQEKEAIDEVRKDKMKKLIEDILTKKSKNSDIQKKGIYSDLPIPVKKTLKKLIASIEDEGFSKNEIIKYIRNELKDE
jgi:hypothetical protein